MSSSPSLARIIGLLSILALALAGQLADAEGALATTIQLGQLAPQSLGKGNGCTSCNFIQAATRPGATGYAVPAGSWTLTSWSSEGGQDGGMVALRVFRPTGKPEEFSVVGMTSFEEVKAKKSPSFAVSLPVRTGDVIGISTGNAGVPVEAESGTAMDRISAFQPGGISIGSLIGPSDPFMSNSSGGRLNVTAKLTSNDGALTVTKTGAGAGSVASAPAGIDCGALCSGSFQLLLPLTLTATPAPGSEFGGWTGGGCGAGAACTLSMTGPTALTARFDPTHAFTLGRLTRVAAKGTAKLTASVPGPGLLVLAGKGIRKETRRAKAAGKVTLPVISVGKPHRALLAKGRRKFALGVTFTPSGGTPARDARTVALVKR